MPPAPKPPAHKPPSYRPPVAKPRLSKREEDRLSAFRQLSLGGIGVGWVLWQLPAVDGLIPVADAPPALAPTLAVTSIVGMLILLVSVVVSYKVRRRERPAPGQIGFDGLDTEIVWMHRRSAFLKGYIAVMTLAIGLILFGGAWEVDVAHLLVIVGVAVPIFVFTQIEGEM